MYFININSEYDEALIINSLVDTFKIYSKFFENENKISLLQGRDYLLVDLFFSVMIEIMDNSSSSNKIVEYVAKLRKQIKEYFTKAEI